MNSDLIYDWNALHPQSLRPAGHVLLNDETLRDGLQSPSVRDPLIQDSIAILHKSYGKIIDSIWTPVAAYLAGLEEKYDLDAAYDRVRTAENKSLDQMAIYGPAAKQLLTPEQVRKLPPFIALFLDNQALRQIRPGRAGGGRGGFFGT